LIITNKWDIKILPFFSKGRAGRGSSNAVKLREVNEIEKNPYPPSVGLPFEKKGRNSV